MLSRNLFQLRAWERKLIEEGLHRLGDVPKAKDILAEQLGMSRATIYRKIKEDGLDNHSAHTN